MASLLITLILSKRVSVQEELEFNLHHSKEKAENALGNTYDIPNHLTREKPNHIVVSVRGWPEAADNDQRPHKLRLHVDEMASLGHLNEPAYVEQAKTEIDSLVAHQPVETDTAEAPGLQ